MISTSMVRRMHTLLLLDLENYFPCHFSCHIFLTLHMLYLQYESQYIILTGSIAIESTKQSAELNDAVLFTCKFDLPSEAVANEVEPGVKWYLNDTELTSNIDNDRINRSPEGISVYKISSIAIEDMGYYSCKVSYNKFSLEGTSDKLPQYVQYIDTTDPIYIRSTESITLTCVVFGGPMTIKWVYASDTSEVDLTNSRYTMSNSVNEFNMVSELQITNVEFEDASTYKCMAAYNSGEKTSNDHVLHVLGKNSNLRI